MRGEGRRGGGGGVRGTTAKMCSLLPFLFRGIYKDFSADPDPAFHVKRTRIHLFTSMRIRNRILDFIKIMGFCDHWSIDPPWSPFRASTALHGSVWASKASEFWHLMPIRIRNPAVCSYVRCSLKNRMNTVRTVFIAFYCKLKGALTVGRTGVFQGYYCAWVRDVWRADIIFGLNSLLFISIGSSSMALWRERNICPCRMYNHRVILTTSLCQ